MTQAWLATSDSPEASVTGRSFFHQPQKRVSAAAQRPDLQDRLLDACQNGSGVALG